MNKDKSVEDILKESKNMDYLQNILSYVKDINVHTQDSVLEEMIQNEAVEKLSDSITSMRKEMNKGFKDLSFIRNDARPMNKEESSYSSGVVEAEYINLSESTMSKMASMFPTVQEQEALAPQMASNASQLIALNTEIRDLIKRQNFVDTNAIELNSPQVYQEKSIYYLKEMKDDIEAIYTILKGNEMDVASSSDSFKGIDKKDEKDGGMFDNILSTLGLKPVWDALKTGFQKVSGFIDKAFAPIIGVVKKGFQWVGKKASGALESIFTKIVGSKWFAKFANSKVGQMAIKGVSKIAGFLGPVGKILGKATKFIPGVGQIITIATSLWSFTDGLKNADKIVGKAKDKLSTMEKVGAGLSGIISDLTIGLVEPQTIYKGLKMAGGMIMETIDLIKGVFPKSVRQATDKVFNAIFDEKKGIFGSVIQGFKKTIDSLMNDGMWAGIKTFFFSSLNNLFEIPKRIVGSIVDMMAPDLGKMDTKGMGDMVGKVFDKITDLVMDFLGAFMSFSTAGMIGKDSLKKGFNSAKDMAGGAVDSVKGFFGFGDDKKPEAKEVAAKIDMNKQASQVVQKADIASVPKALNAEATTKLTQETSQPVNKINVPPAQNNIMVQAPPQQRSVNRKTKAGSDTVLTLNSASGRP